MANTVVYSRLGDKKALDALTPTGKYLDGAAIRLFRNNFQPDADSLLSDFQVCIFSGMATSAALNWDPAFYDSQKIVTVQGGSVQFRQTGSTGDTVQGWYMVGAPGGSEYLLASRKFDTPVAFTEAGDGLVVDPVFQLPRGVVSPVIVPAAAQKAILDLLVAATYPWTAPKLMLWKQVTDPDPDMLYASFTPTTFTGYALSAAVVFGAAYYGQPKIATVAGASKQFTQSATTVTDDVRGWMLVGDPAGTPFVIASQKYDNTQSFDVTGRGVVVTPELQLF